MPLYHQFPAINVETLSCDDGSFAAGKIHDKRRNLVCIKTATNRRQACLIF
jgi:hypothetical protein